MLIEELHVSAGGMGMEWNAVFLGNAEHLPVVAYVALNGLIGTKAHLSGRHDAELAGVPPVIGPNGCFGGSPGLLGRNGIGAAGAVLLK